MSVFIASFNGINLSNLLPYVSILNIGIFVVLTPAIYIAKDHPRISMHNDNDDGISLTPFIKSAPILIIILLLLSFIFAVYGFASSLMLNSGSVEFVNGNYILKINDNIKFISENEYNKLNLEGFKKFSSAWLIFYSIGILIINGLIRWEKDEYVY